MEEKEEQQVSKYNSGINIIMRLDALWKKINNSVIMGKYFLWNILLDRVWCELARDIKIEIEETDSGELQHKIGQYEQEIRNYDKKILEIGEIKDNLKEEAGFEEIDSDDIVKRGKHYRALMDKEIFLRRLENELGKGTAFEDNDEDGFE